MVQSTHHTPLDLARQILILIAAPLIWVCSSLGLFVETARSPAAFSDLSLNLLVPQTFAFTIWLPIFLGIFAYSIIQSLRVNRGRAVFRDTGWWIAFGLWGIVLWGLVTAFAPDSSVEVLASLIFMPSMIALVIAMVKLFRQRSSLDSTEHWLVLVPISLIAGWCSIAVFIGLNGLLWNFVESLGWGLFPTSVMTLAVALCWAIIVLLKGAANKAYAFPIIWGLAFLALRHFSEGGTTILAATSCAGIIAIVLTITITPKVQTA